MREDWPAIDVDAQIDPPVDGLIDPVERMRAYRVVPEVISSPASSWLSWQYAAVRSSDTSI